ncbi:MAG: AbrB/MazE/SpoVT family DNA-binding domain-containing protein [Caulobacteraceae bacterium]
MKATGIVRKLDQLGRIVIPMETRREFDIDIGDSLEVYVDEERIILKKYEPGCIFCGNVDNIEIYKGKKVCRNCIKEMV